MESLGCWCNCWRYSRDDLRIFWHVPWLNVLPDRNFQQSFASYLRGLRFEWDSQLTYYLFSLPNLVDYYLITVFWHTQNGSHRAVIFLDNCNCASNLSYLFCLQIPHYSAVLISGISCSLPIGLSMHRLVSGTVWLKV